MEKSAEVTLVDLVADPPPFGVEARPVTTLNQFHFWALQLAEPRHRTATPGR